MLGLHCARASNQRAHAICALVRCAYSDAASLPTAQASSPVEKVTKADDEHAKRKSNQSRPLDVHPLEVFNCMRV